MVRYAHVLLFMRIFAKTKKMKTRINLTIEEKIAKLAKYYAEEHNTSVSEMVQEYLIDITSRKHQQPAMTHLFKTLKRPAGQYNGRDLAKEFYEAKGGK